MYGPGVFDMMNRGASPLRKKAPYEQMLENPTPTVMPGQAPVIPGLVEQEPEIKPENGLMAAYKELMMRQNGPAMSAYQKFLETGAPKEDDYKPSKKRRLAAALSGGLAAFGGDPNASDRVTRILESPYRRAVSKHQSEATRLKESAGMEESMWGKRLQTVKELREYENQIRDDERAEGAAKLARQAEERQLANTKSLIESRELGMEETKKRIDQMGQRWNENKETGMLELVLPDGTVTPIGRFDKSSGAKIIDEKEMAIFRENLDRVSAQQSDARQLKNAKDLKASPSSVDSRETPISATQQAAASRQAANEVLNNPKFSKLRDKEVTVGTSGYQIKNPENNWADTWGQNRRAAAKKQYEDTVKLLTDFEEAVKKRAAEITGTTRKTTSSRQYEPVP